MSQKKISSSQVAEIEKAMGGRVRPTSPAAKPTAKEIVSKAIAPNNKTISRIPSKKVIVPDAIMQTRPTVKPAIGSLTTAPVLGGGGSGGGGRAGYESSSQADAMEYSNPPEDGGAAKRKRIITIVIVLAVILLLFIAWKKFKKKKK